MWGANQERVKRGDLLGEGSKMYLKKDQENAQGKTGNTVEKSRQVRERC